MSVSRALKVGRKYVMLSSITYSRLISVHFDRRTDNVRIPNLKEISNKSLQELRRLKIEEVRWCDYDLTHGLSFKLCDGQVCTAGNPLLPYFSETYKFDLAKKITRISCNLYSYKRDHKTLQIHFYHGEKLLVKLGNFHE
jgi:hypothetical protein